MNSNTTRRATADIEKDLAIIEDELAKQRELAFHEPALTKRLAFATSDLALAPAGEKDAATAALATARARLREAQLAVETCRQLELRLVELRASVEWSRGQDRQDRCNELREEFDRLYESYKGGCQVVLEQFNALRQIDLTWRSLSGGAQLLDDAECDLNLPCLRRPDEWINPAFPTGRKAA